MQNSFLSFICSVPSKVAHKGEQAKNIRWMLKNGRLFIAQHALDLLTEQCLKSHHTHYRSYRGRVFTGQMTQPTVSKH